MRLMTEKDFKYQMMIYWDFHNKTFIGEIPELDGCVISGKTQKEAFDNLNTAMVKWVRKAQQVGMLIPEPLGKIPVMDDAYCMSCDKVNNTHSPRWIRSKE